MKEHSSKIAIIVFMIFFVSLPSCNNNTKYVEQFPFSEDELIEYNFGAILEYAIFDSTKIDFVKSLICDSIAKNQKLIFKKYETEINDSSYFFFSCHEKDFSRSDYPGILYYNINRLDSFSNNFYKRYGINDIGKIIKELAEFNKTSIDGVIKKWKVGNIYIPYLICIVYFDSFNCEDGFVEKVLFFNKTINKVMDAYSEKQFPDEKITIRPQIEIQINFNLLYPPPLNSKK